MRAVFLPDHGAYDPALWQLNMQTLYAYTTCQSEHHLSSKR